MDEINNTKSKINILKNKGHAMYKLINSENIDDITAFLKETLGND
jgi:hypothetical protein